MNEAIEMVMRAGDFLIVALAVSALILLGMLSADDNKQGAGSVASFWIGGFLGFILAYFIWR